MSRGAASAEEMEQRRRKWAAFREAHRETIRRANTGVPSARPETIAQIAARLGLQVVGGKVG